MSRRGVPLQSGGVQPLRAGSGVCEDGWKSFLLEVIQVKETHSWKTRGEAEDVNYLSL